MSDPRSDTVPDLDPALAGPRPSLDSPFLRLPQTFLQGLINRFVPNDNHERLEELLIDERSRLLDEARIERAVRIAVKDPEGAKAITGDICQMLAREAVRHSQANDLTSFTNVLQDLHYEQGVVGGLDELKEFMDPDDAAFLSPYLAMISRVPTEDPL